MQGGGGGEELLGAEVVAGCCQASATVCVRLHEGDAGVPSSVRAARDVRVGWGLGGGGRGGEALGFLSVVGWRASCAVLCRALVCVLYYAPLCAFQLQPLCLLCSVVCLWPSLA